MRALSPHIGAFAELPGGERLGVLAAHARPDDEGPPPGDLAMRDGCPVLGTGAGGLELVTVQPAGRRPMAGADWLRGRR